MKLIDSNILIYSSEPENHFLRDYVSEPDNGVSRFTELEVLGYHSLSPKDEQYFLAAFRALKIYPVDQAVVQKAISLPQRQSMSAGDSIIAATALLYQLELVTRNEADFKWIPELRIENPFSLLG